MQQAVWAVFEISRELQFVRNSRQQSRKPPATTSIIDEPQNLGTSLKREVQAITRAVQSEIRT